MIGIFSIKRVSKNVLRGDPEQYEPDLTLTQYDVLKDGKKVGSLETNDLVGSIHGELFGKGLPELSNYGWKTSSGPLGNLHAFLKSKTGQRWATTGLLKGKNIFENGSKPMKTVNDILYNKNEAAYHPFGRFRVADPVARTQKIIKDGAASLARKTENNVQSGVEEYLKIANAALLTHEDSKFFKERNRSFAVKKASKYYKLWIMEWGRESSIHAFIDAETGEVFKPAGINKPASGARGNVTDQKWLSQLKTTFDIYGGYLYAKR